MFESYLMNNMTETADSNNKTSKMSNIMCEDEQSKKTFHQGLTCMLFAASIKELQEDALPFTVGVLRQFALLAVTQQGSMYSQQPSHSGKKKALKTYHRQQPRRELLMH